MYAPLTPPWLEVIFLERHFAMQGHKAAPVETLIPNSHMLNVSLLCPVKVRKKKSLYSSLRELKMLQPKLLTLVQPSDWDMTFLPDCQWFSGTSCGGDLEVHMPKIKTPPALIWVRACIPFTQVIKCNRWRNYLNTNGLTPPTLLKYCQNQNLQKESCSPHSTASTWNEIAPLWITSSLRRLGGVKTPQCSLASDVSDKVMTINNMSSSRSELLNLGYTLESPREL